MECSNPGITTILAPAAAGLAARVQVVIPKETDLAAEDETVTVYTDDPEFPKLVCRIDAVRAPQQAGRQAGGSVPNRVQQVSAVTSAPATQAMAGSAVR